jgi:membrane peptidoglycan carboxypeptidase
MRILAMYLDAAYFCDGAFGIGAAARTYFGLARGQLSWGQASLLAALLQAPSAYKPHRNLHAALARQHQVLDHLVAVGALARRHAAQIAAARLHPVMAFRG